MWLGGLILAMASTVLGPPGLAQVSTAASQGPSPEVQAAMQKADGGDPDSLLALADGGDPTAQYYAGVMYLFGRGKVAKDPPRGCAYEQKASSSRADAMHLVGLCYQTGAGGEQDKAKAEAAYLNAAQMGFPKSTCALGQMLMAEPQEAERGLGLCKQAAEAGDLDAQAAVGNAYFNGTSVTQDRREARKWYEMAARQNDPGAQRRLGEMYARGDGGKRDPKKAMSLWLAAEKAGDPLAAILVADQLFSELTGGRTPGPGQYAFRGGVPVGDVKVVESWYQAALDRDPRPDIQQRARYALQILGSFNTAAQSATVAR